MKKTCTKCGEEKELELFVYNKNCNNKREGICKICMGIYKKKYYNQNKERAMELKKKWRKNNPKKYKNQMKRATEAQKKKRDTDDLYKLTLNIRCLINNSIKIKGKFIKKKSNTREILGCSYKEFKKHLESQFQEGMNWDNHGINGWHIDHIYPVSKAKDERHLIELNHYTNLQPLWAKDNIAKGNKILPFNNK